MTISERMAIGLRTAHLSSRQFAAVTGCHFTTIARLLREDDSNPLGMTRTMLEERLDRLEELIAEGQLPFDRGTPRKEKAERLQRLFTNHY